MSTGVLVVGYPGYVIDIVGVVPVVVVGGLCVVVPVVAGLVVTVVGDVDVDVVVVVVVSLTVTVPTMSTCMSQWNL